MTKTLDSSRALQNLWKSYLPSPQSESYVQFLAAQLCPSSVNKRPTPILGLQRERQSLLRNMAARLLSLVEPLLDGIGVFL
jgi:hypothetical protein